MFQEIHKDPNHLRLGKICRKFSHDWYMFSQQCKIVALKFCCSFTQNSSKHFFIYCHLPLVCFCIAPFGSCSTPCTKLYVLCNGLYFCLCLLAIHITFLSLQCSALQYSFGTVNSFLVFILFLSATILNFDISYFEICITLNDS